jgi:YVTN family beta-propeller protein
MNPTHRAPWYAAALVALGMLAASDAVRANHYILPCGDQCDPAPPLAYIGNVSSDYATVIDTSTNTVIATVDVGQTTTGVAMSPDGTRVYMANGRSLVVIETATGARVYLSNGAVVDTATNEVVATIPAVARGLAINSSGTRIYAPQETPPALLVIDTETGAVVAAIPLEGTPYAVGQFVTPTARDHPGR